MLKDNYNKKYLTVKTLSSRNLLYKKYDTKVLPLVSIIVINYNGLKYLNGILYKCIESIINNKYDNFELLFIDNGSSDNSIEFIKKYFGYDKRLKFLKLNQNYGTSKAKNIGIRNSKGKYVLLMNNDVILLKLSLKKMINVMINNDEVAIIGCKLIYPNGKLQSSGEYYSYYLSILNVFSTKLWRRKIKYKQKNKNMNIVEYLIGAAILINKEIILKINLYDEDYFMYHEEIDLAYKINKAGYKIICLDNCHIIHYENLTGRYFNKWKNNLLARNELLFIYKNYIKIDFAIALFLYIFKLIIDIFYSFIKLDKFYFHHVLSKIKSFSYIKNDVEPPQ